MLSARTTANSAVPTGTTDVIVYMPNSKSLYKVEVLRLRSGLKIYTPHLAGDIHLLSEGDRR